MPTNIPGSPGQNAYSTITAPFAIPASTAIPVLITMGSTAWAVPGQFIIVSDSIDGRGTFVVQSVVGPNQISALWANAAGDSVSGTVFQPANTPIVTGTGAPGMAGTNGTNAYTILTANSAIPADTNTPVTFAVGNSQWAVVGQTIVVGDAVDGIGTFRITAIPDSLHITALWLNAVGDAAPLATLNVSNLATVSPAGVPQSPKFRFTSVASSSNSGTGETTLLAASVPANTLANVGDSVEFEASFVLSGSGNNTVKVYFGATNFLTLGPVAQNSGSVIVRGRVMRISGTSQKVYGAMWITAGLTANAVTTNDTTAAETLSGAVLLKCTGQNSVGSGAVTQDSLFVRLNAA